MNTVQYVWKENEGKRFTFLPGVMVRVNSWRTFGSLNSTLQESVIKREVRLKMIRSLKFEDWLACVKQTQRQAQDNVCETPVNSKNNCYRNNSFACSIEHLWVLKNLFKCVRLFVPDHGFWGER